jgi:hypothetical protein
VFFSAGIVGYEILRVRPIECYAIGDGEMFVGKQDFLRRCAKSTTAIRSISYIFLLGNEKFSIDGKLRYIDGGDYGQVDKKCYIEVASVSKI